MFSHQKNDYSIIYNNGYKLVNYSNFSDYHKCINLSVLENITDIFQSRTN